MSARLAEEYLEFAYRERQSFGYHLDKENNRRPQDCQPEFSINGCSRKAREGRKGVARRH
jgi:hypothetical protein